ncbi:MAG: hypothetical protein WDO15_09820 [Bacteroidota bacterium]
MLGVLGSTTLSSNITFPDVLYQINFALFLSFLIAGIHFMKRLILYQKSKWLIRMWTVFEFALLIILLYNIVQVSITEELNVILMVLFGILTIMLSANMKWVAISTSDKSGPAFSFSYSHYSTSVISSGRLCGTCLPSSPRDQEWFLSYKEHFFNLCLFFFVITYSVFSFLVILFNLPTSSVFDTKTGGGRQLPAHQPIDTDGAE